jgi:serine/threonine protein kinase
MIGTQIRQFKIIEKLGAGGMGEVYVAEDIRLRRRVALKFLPPHYSADPEFKARFEHEAMAAAGLNHPNIITVHDLGENEGRLYIVLELVEGQSLDALIKSGALTVSKTVEIILQVCDGLRAAHEAGIVHRDIKPANILIV